jgi:protein MpaA
MKVLWASWLVGAAVAAATPTSLDIDTELFKNLKPEDIIVTQFCSEIRGVYARNKWGAVPLDCEKVPWKVMGWSVQKRPMLSFEGGDTKTSKLTLIQCGIHGDELPSLAMCMNLIAEVSKGPRKIPAKIRLVVQPLLNPDGMFRQPVSRHNANGIDINRNFPTQDWKAKAQDVWRLKEKQDPRKFPGDQAGSEPETQAIMKFVEEFKPQKILSIHTPLGFLDLDTKSGGESLRRAKYLAVNMSKNSGNFKFLRFGFYPGSLGNFAGQERQIPVYTLELPPGDNRPTIDNYWKKFRLALWRAIDFDLDTGEFLED